MVSSIDSIMYNISQLDEKNAKVNTALSTGEALEYGSDDATLYSYILDIKSDISTYESIEENITLSDAFNTTSDDTLSSIKDTTDAIISELISANTDTTTDDDRLIIAEQVESYKDMLLSLANTDVDGQYIFSGINTDTQAFAEDSSGSIVYQSDNSVKQVNVEENTYADQGVNGIDVFYYETGTADTGESMTFTENDIILDEDGNQWQLVDTDGDSVYDGLYLNGDSSSTSLAITDNGDGTYSATNTSSTELQVNHSIFDALDEVIAALKLEDTDGNTITSDEASTLLDNAIDNMNDAYDSQNIAHALVGNRTSTIETYGDVVSSKLTNLAVLEEDYASADLTELAVEAQSLENTYTALYTAINRVYSLSLVNYLS